MNRWLFPGEGESAKGPALLSQQIGDLTEEIAASASRRTSSSHHGDAALQPVGNDAATVARALGNDEATSGSSMPSCSQEEALRSWNETLKLKQEELAPLIEATAPSSGAGVGARDEQPALVPAVSAWSPQDQAALRMAHQPRLRRARAGRAARWRPGDGSDHDRGVRLFLGSWAPTACHGRSGALPPVHGERGLVAIRRAAWSWGDQALTGRHKRWLPSRCSDAGAGACAVALDERRQLLLLSA